MPYGKSNYDKLKRRLDDRRQRQEETEGFWKPEVKKTYIIRILPPPPSHDLWYMEYGVHYGILDDPPENTSPHLTCPKRTLNEPCPACIGITPLWRGDARDRATASRIGAKTRYVSGVLVLSDKNPEPKMWSYGDQVWKQLAEIAVTEDGSIVPIDDPDKGYNLKLTVDQKVTQDQKSGERRTFPAYTVTPVIGSDGRASKPISDKSVLDRMYDFRKVILGRLKSYDEMRALLDPEDGPKTDDDVEVDEGGTAEVVEENETAADPDPEVENAETDEPATSVTAKARAALARTRARKP